MIVTNLSTLLQELMMNGLNIMRICFNDSSKGLHPHRCSLLKIRYIGSTSVCKSTLNSSKKFSHHFLHRTSVFYQTFNSFRYHLVFLSLSELFCLVGCVL